MSGTTNQKRTCQECNSENIKFSDKRQAYVCVDCLHEFTITSSGHPRIFISYARDDGEEFARKLRRCLVEEHGFSVWQDRTEMQVGEAWWQQIESALRNEHVEYLVLVMTPAAMKSEMVRKEWRLARQEGVCVLPVIASPGLDIDSLPPWMCATHFADLRVPEEKKRFIRILEGPCKIQRVPFMVEDLPGDFVPREQEFEQIVLGLLDTQREGPVAITAALQGAGGFGKTTLAQIICHDERIQEDFYDGILWVTLSEKPGDLITYVEDFIRILSGEPSGLINLQAATARLRELLADRHILMVIDDVWNSAHLRPFLQGGPLCARLITTRNLDTVPANARKVDVDAMKEHEATALLASGLSSSHETDMTKLAARLGEWPLLLKLVNGVLRHRVYNTGQELTDALGYVNTALDKRGLTSFDIRNTTQRDQAVEKTLGVSIELLHPDERTRYGELAVFPEDEDIPLAALEKLWNKTGGLDEFDTEDLCDRFMRLSLLLNFDLNKRHIRLHDVMREYLIQKRNDTLPILHNQLLEAYCPSNQNIPQWADLSPDEPYIWNNLAYHLIEAGRNEKLQQLLLDFNWLQAKLEVTDISSLVSDYNNLPDDPVLKLVHGALRLSAHVLTWNKKQMADQLLGRLQIFKETEIQSMLEHARKSKSGTWLHPLTTSLTPPGGPLMRTLEGHSYPVNAVAVTSDGRLAISASYDKTLKIWDMDTGEQLRTLEGHTEAIRAVAVTPDDQCVISAACDRTLKVWDIKTGMQLRTLEGHTEAVRAVTVTPDGKHVISAACDRTLKIWDIKTGEQLHTLKGHTEWVNAVAVTPDGRFAISASYDKTLKVWDVSTGKQLRTLEGHTEAITAVAVTSDGERVISASIDRTLKVWDIKTGEQLSTLEGHTDWIWAVAVTPNCRHAISASIDKTLKVWDIKTGQQLRTLSGHTDWVTVVVVSPDNRHAISASYDRTLKVWDVETMEQLPTLGGHIDSVRGVAVTHDDRHAISASGDNTLKVWDLKTGTQLSTMEGHTEWVRAVAVTPDCMHAISASSDKTLKVWNIKTGEKLYTLKGHDDWVNAVAVTSDGRLAISASDDKTLKIWDMETGKELHTLKGHDGWVNAVAMIPNSKRAISASVDNTLKVWDMKTGKELYTLKGHIDWVWAVAVTLDGERVISGSKDRTLKVWDMKTGKELCTLKGHTEEIRAVAVTPDGRRAISASFDKTLKVWDIETGEIVTGFSGDSPLKSCTISSDGLIIVAGEDLGRVHFLRLEENEENPQLSNR